MDWARGCAYCIIVHVCVNMTCSLALHVNKKGFLKKRTI